MSSLRHLSPEQDVAPVQVTVLKLTGFLGNSQGHCALQNERLCQLIGGFKHRLVSHHRQAVLSECA